MHQLLTDPSHFTEHSSSLLDLILVSNKEHLILHGVGDPFLDQQLRYHCPIYGFCKFSKPKAKAFTRHIWMYNNGNFGLLREKASSFDWHALENDDISLYASNLNSTILSLTKECIPNKSMRVRTSDPPWITTLMKRQIRKRKRLYRKAKQTNLERHWIKFRQLRNETSTMIRNSNQQFYDNIAEKLKSKSLSSKDWWSTLKILYPLTLILLFLQLNLKGSYIQTTLKKQIFLIITFKGKQFLTTVMLSFLNYLNLLILQVLAVSLLILKKLKKFLKL